MNEVIGYYNYTVWATYVGMAFSVIGITLAAEGHATWAVVFLMLSGFCDSIDGMVARTKKDRTRQEIRFGMQIDSLCDVLCFGVFPAVICYTLGVSGIIGKAVLVFYCGCGIIRLAYFNVLAEEKEEGARRYYHGLPITFMSAILPLAYLLRVWMPTEMFSAWLHAVLVVTGLFFVLDIPVPRTKVRVAVSLMLTDIAAVLFCMFSGVW